MQNPLKNESGKGLNWYFSKDAHEKPEGGGSVRSDLKKLSSFTQETSKNHLIRNLLRNGRLRVMFEPPQRKAFSADHLPLQTTCSQIRQLAVSLKKIQSEVFEISENCGLRRREYLKYFFVSFQGGAEINELCINRLEKSK